MFLFINLYKYQIYWIIEFAKMLNQETRYLTNIEKILWKYITIPLRNIFPKLILLFILK